MHCDQDASSKRFVVIIRPFRECGETNAMVLPFAVKTLITTFTKCLFCSAFQL